MDFEYYNLKGTNSITDDYCFMVSPCNTTFPNDNIFYELDDMLIQINTSYQYKFFPLGDYLNVVSLLPKELTDAGINTESELSKLDFEKFIKENEGNEIYNKVLLFNDISVLINSIQDRILETKSLYISFYKRLNKIENPMPLQHNNSTIILSGYTTISLFSYLENFIIKLYSVLDLLTKLCFENEASYTDFTKYNKMKSRNITFEKRNFPKFAGKSSVFCFDDDINLLTTLRNRIIHDGTLMYQNCLYFVFENATVTEKFILMMDNSNGNIDNCVNRNRFYHSEIKLNEVLPSFYERILKRIKTTLELMQQGDFINICL
jgi:hypothetical protein